MKQKLRTVYLHGRLGRLYGRKHELAIDTAAEALRALKVRHPGFARELAKADGYRITRGRHGHTRKDGMDLAESQLDLGLGSAPALHIAPVMRASGFDPISWIVIAAVTVVAVAVAVSVMPTIKPPDANDREDDRKSWLFDGPVNVSEQGHPIPVVYGRMLVGSIVGSAGIDVTDVPYSALPEPANSTPGFWDSPEGMLLLFTLLKGKGKGGGSQRSAKEDPNTLQSQATARILDLLAEGEIGGLVDGLKSVYFNDTVVQNQDDSFNFQGVALTFRDGTPDQDYIPDASAQETPRIVNQEVSNLLGPEVQTITDADTNRARVIVGVNALTFQDTSNGDLLKHKVAIAVDLQSDGGGYTTVVNYTFDGKTTSPYQKAFTISLPEAGNPWDIRVRRVTADSSTANIQDDVFFVSLTEIVDAKLFYPNTALVHLIVDAKQFGTDIPTRAYEIYGRIIEVPTNYDPVARTYATTGPGTTGGEWDGTFKLAWSDNPAWCTRDLCINERFGLGKRVPASRLDKWQLYEIAKYCDAWNARPGGSTDDYHATTGKHGIPDGSGGFEPRYTMNVCLRTRKKALEVLAAMATTFNSVLYWSAGAVQFSQDSPADPDLLVTQANTIDGQRPVYEGGDIDELYSAVIVWWNDPEDAYRLAPEIIEDPDLRRKIGWKPKELTAYACTRKSQARRVGLAFMDEQKYGNKIVRYGAGPDHYAAGPGTIVSVAENVLQGLRAGGRIKSATTTAITLDAPTTLLSGQTYSLMCVLADGSVETRTVSNSAGAATVLTVSSAFSSAPLPNAIWSLKSSAVTQRQFRLVEKKEVDSLEYQIVGKLHDPLKYDRIEQGLIIEPLDTTFNPLPEGPLEMPAGLAVFEFLRGSGNSAVPSVLWSWSSATDPRVVGYHAMVVRPGADNMEPLLPHDQSVSREMVNAQPGVHKLRVRSFDGFGRFSAWVEKEFTLVGYANAPGNVTGLTVVTDNDAATTYLTWVRPANEVRPISYEVFYNAANNYGTATSLGVVNTLQFPVASVGYYWVVPRFMTVLASSPTPVQVEAGDLPTIDISGYLTNQTVSLLADAAGTVSSFTPANSQFKVFDGLTDVTTGNGVVYSKVSETGMTSSINSSTGAITVSAMSADSATATYRAVYAGVTIDLVYNLTKSKNASTLSLRVDKQAFTFDPDGSANPASQNIVITADRQNISGTIVWTSSPTVTLTGSGDSRTLSLANFGSNEQVTITATIGAVSDTISVVRLRAGGNLFTITKSSNVSLTGRAIKKESGSEAWDSQAYSNESYVGAAFCSARPNQTNKNAMFGLNQDPTADASYTGLDHAWYVRADGNLEIYESSVKKWPTSGTETYATTDVLSIVYDGAAIRYYKNGVLKRTAAAADNVLRFYFDSSLYGVGGQLNDVAFGPSGAAPNKQVTLYQRSQAPPDLATGDAPSGWSSSQGSGDVALWSITGTLTAVGVLVGEWSAPALVSTPNWRGAFNAAETYYAEDAVTYNGGSYKCRVESAAHCIVVSIGDETPGMRIKSPSGLSIAGATYTKIRCRWRYTTAAAPTWDGTAYYTTGGHGESESFKKTVSEPADFRQGHWMTTEWDMSALTAGGTDWTTNTITQLRLDLVSSAFENLEVDYVEVVSSAGVVGQRWDFTTGAESWTGVQVSSLTHSGSKAPSGTADANAWWDVISAPGAPGEPGTPPSGFTATIDLSSSTSGVNLRTVADAAGYTGLSDATITFEVESGVNITGLAGSPHGGIAIDSGSWPTSTYTIALTLTIKSGGIVRGGGGKGGVGGADNPGGNGGDAIYCRLPMTVNINSGAEVKGGGGGGGGGDTYADTGGGVDP